MRSVLLVSSIPQDLDFDLQLYFTYGATFEPTTSGPIEDFERRVGQYFRKSSTRLGLNPNPDFILWASGTWDVIHSRNKLFQDNKAGKVKTEVEQGMSWDELVWHRRRLLEMKSYIEQEYPGIPNMYRTPTDASRVGLPNGNPLLEGMRPDDVDSLNESFERIRQSASGLSKIRDFPIFRWSEKLAGLRDYQDAVHIQDGSGAQHLYANMLLHYTKSYTSASPSFCMSRV